MDQATKHTIVFFGSGPVAAASLKLIVKSFNIEAVVTKPRPLHHKGSVPVLELATDLNLPIFEVNSKKDLSQKISDASFSSDVAVLIDFGIIVNQDVIDAFPLGIINSHFSLLPELRGADPITFAILSGQKHTGVSLMKIVEAMDEGPLIAFGIQDLDDTSTAPWLTEKLILLSNALLEKELPRYIRGEAKPIEQSEIPALVTDFDYPRDASYSRKLSKADSVLDFSKSALQLDREIRAFLEWPKSRTTIANKEVIVTKAHANPGNSKEVGTVFVDNRQLCIQTSEGLLIIDKLKPVGKQEMNTPAFLAGYGKNL